MLEKAAGKRSSLQIGDLQINVISKLEVHFSRHNILAGLLHSRL